MGTGPQIQGKGAAIPEPAPRYGGKAVFPELIKDIEARAELGKRKYGGYLTTNNGRSAVVDAYQEALDLAVYLKQHMMESDMEWADRMHDRALMLGFFIGGLVGAACTIIAFLI